MPNYCYNDLYISGPRADVDALLRAVGADCHLPALNFQTADGSNYRAYEVRRRDCDLPCISFQTRWGPDFPELAELHRQHPRVTLHLEYSEKGMSFIGGLSFYSEKDWTDYVAGRANGPWAPGKAADAWEYKGYRGHRGG